MTDNNPIFPAPFAEVQTRSLSGEVRVFPTMDAAFRHALANEDVWKISWTVAETGERIRLARDSNTSWVYEPILETMIKERMPIECTNPDCVIPGLNHTGPCVLKRLSGE